MIKHSGPVITKFEKDVREDATFTYKIREERKHEANVEEESIMFPSGIELKIVDERDSTENSVSKDFLPGCFSFGKNFPIKVNREYDVYKTKISVQRFMPPYGGTTFNIFGIEVSELCISTMCRFDMPASEEMFSETRIFLNGNCADAPNPQLRSYDRIHWGLGIKPGGPTEVEYHGEVRKQIINILTANLNS